MMKMSELRKLPIVFNGLGLPALQFCVPSREGDS
jgi:hypothetical protein